ncbi:MAG: polyphosphate polymerase domain-containing protein [Oligoflexia bacterium]|nr:polyphosphate polymerase domain-containing protein [Oligoflexia bacterium]
MQIQIQNLEKTITDHDYSSAAIKGTIINDTTINDESFFVRYEDKYILNLSQYYRILDLVERKMTPAYGDRLREDNNISFTLIESTYLDSNDFCFYKNHILSKPIRQKIRIRSYAPMNIKEDNNYLLELKQKEFQQTQKSRFVINQLMYDDLINKGKWPAWSEELIALNLKLKEKKLYKRYQLAHQLFEELHLIKSIKVGYVRQAFEADGIRITFDRNVYSPPLEEKEKLSFCEFEKMNPDILNLAGDLLKKYGQQGGDEEVIMELKYKNNNDDDSMNVRWPFELLGQEKLQKTSFSKYCYFMTKHILSSSNQMNSIKGMIQ